VYKVKYDKLINNKKILITGGAGFVGSHLAKTLYNYGNTIHVLDNYFTGSIENHIQGVSYIKAETSDIFSLYKNVPLDYIFHLGEYSRVEQSYKDIELVVKYNISPFYQVLKLTSHLNAKLIYSGSSTKFSHDLEAVESPYSFTKRMNTELLVQYANWFNIDFAITYFYNVYGPGEISKGKYATVIAKFIELKKQKVKYLPITKPGTQRRRFTHIDDVVNGLIIVAKKGLGDDFGIGANKSYTILEVAEMLEMSFKIEGYVKGNRFDGLIKTKKTKELGWKPTKSLKQYLQNKK
jgi:UDP-glucose 4-epimerase